jgi:hypothetical protein
VGMAVGFDVGMADGVEVGFCVALL